MPLLGPLEYGFVFIAAVILFGLVLVVRARRRDRHERDELRAHLRRLGGPTDGSGV